MKRWRWNGDYETSNQGVNYGDGPGSADGGGDLSVWHGDGPRNTSGSGYDILGSTQMTMEVEVEREALALGV